MPLPSEQQLLSLLARLVGPAPRTNLPMVPFPTGLGSGGLTGGSRGRSVGSGGASGSRSVGGYTDYGKMTDQSRQRVAEMIAGGAPPEVIEQLFNLSPGQQDALRGFPTNLTKKGSTTGSSGGQNSLSDMMRLIEGIQSGAIPESVGRQMWPRYVPQSEQQATGQDAQSLLQAPPERGWGPRGPSQPVQPSGSYPAEFFKKINDQRELDEKNKLRDALNKRYEQTGDVAGTKKMAAQFGVQWEPPEDPEDETPLNIEQARVILQRKLAKEMNDAMDPADHEDPIKPSDVSVPQLDVINLAEQIRSMTKIDKNTDLRELFRKSRTGESPEYVEKYGKGNAGNDAAAKIIEQFPSMADFYIDNDIESGQFIDVDEGFIGEGPRDYGPGYGKAEKRFFPQGPPQGLPQGDIPGLPGGFPELPAFGPQQGMPQGMPGGIPPITEGDQQAGQRTTQYGPVVSDSVAEQYLQKKYQQMQERLGQLGQQEIKWKPNDPKQKAYEKAKDEFGKAMDRDDTGDDNRYSNYQWQQRHIAAEQLLQRMKSNLPTERQPTEAEKMQGIITPAPGGIGVMIRQPDGRVDMWPQQAKTPETEAAMAKAAGLQAQASAQNVVNQKEKQEREFKLKDAKQALEEKLADTKRLHGEQELMSRALESDQKALIERRKIESKEGKPLEESDADSFGTEDDDANSLETFITSYSGNPLALQSIQYVMEAYRFGPEKLTQVQRQQYDSHQKYVRDLMQYKPTVVQNPRDTLHLEDGEYFMNTTDRKIRRYRVGQGIAAPAAANIETPHQLAQ